MDECGCTPEERFMRIGDKILIIENYPRCNFCGNDGVVAIWELDESGLKTYNNMPEFKQLIESAPELSVWMGDNSKKENLIITPKDIGDTLLHYLDCAFERVDMDFDDIDERRFNQLKKRIIKEFKKSIKEGE